VAAAGLLLAALDALAVVTLLPQMLAAVELPIDRIEAAAPIITVFLGGYVVAMPLLGAYSDARGRLPAYAAALAIFGAGSVVTAVAPALGWLILGRILQGLGGGALVPLSLALAADLYRDSRGRGLAVGAVSAVQEAGSVLGPVYGASLAAGLGGWRTVFWLNLPLGGLILFGLWLSLKRPGLSPSADVGRHRRDVDGAGALLLGAGLGLAVLALYPDDPDHRALNSQVVWLGAAALAVLGLFVWRQARHLVPLVSHQLLRERSFVGAMATNLLAGGALMVALADVPILARGVFRQDTLQSGLLLARFLLGVPFGALLGGWLSGRLGQRFTSIVGLVVAALAFLMMSSWGMRQLEVSAWTAYGELAACGFGFGLVIAPLTTAVLDQARTSEHGLASSLVVLARTVGMVLALSALTAFGLSRLHHIVADRHCDTLTAGSGSLSVKLNAYEDCLRGALLQEYREIFLIAATLCLIAALLAFATLPTRSHLRLALLRSTPDAAAQE
jgi:MFS family permease